VTQTLTLQHTPNVTPTVPDAPAIGRAVPGDGQAQIAFTPPANDGGSPIISYTVVCNPNGLTATGTSSPISVTALANGTPYTCSVRATNAIGMSAPSATVSVTPAAAPGGPAITSVDVISSCQDTSSITITVNGTNFAPGSVVQVSGTDRFTTTLSPTQSRVTIFHGDLGPSSAVALRVVNPGGSASPTVMVTIPLPADLNLEGRIDAPDLVITANYLVGNMTPGTAPFTAPIRAADLNHDGNVNAVDIVILANYLVGNISCLTAN
jgi:hypothetical protein